MPSSILALRFLRPVHLGSHWTRTVGVISFRTRRLSTAAPKSSIDADEADKFRQLASQWWDPNGSLGALHSMNRLRVPLIRDGLCPPHAGSEELHSSGKPGDFAPLTGKSILDVGCGGGILAEPLAYLGAHVLGIDQVPESIEVATAHTQLTAHRWSTAKRTIPQYELISLDAVSVRSPASFDAVVMSEVLEHVTDWEGMLHLAEICLKPGGTLFLTTLNKTPESFVFGVLAAEYLMGLVPRGTHDWTKFIEPGRLQAGLVRLGLRPHQLLGMMYNPLTGHWSWTNNMAINYAVTAVKPADVLTHSPSPPITPKEAGQNQV